MSLTAIASAPWAITNQAFAVVQGVLARHLRGEVADLEAVAARLGRPLDNQRADLPVHDGVAVVTLEGVLCKRSNLLTQVSGATSTQIAGDQFARAMADPTVSAIVLAIDSPGGTVDGTQQLAEQVYAARGHKPVTALIDGIGASAAFWIASAAQEVFITGDTAQVGSIGVISSHVDQSGAEAQRGVKVSEVVAGRYKNVASAHAPLTDDGRAVLQAQVDQIYSTFLGDVARNRGVSIDTAHKNMGDGRLFIGRDAIAAGLVDGVTSFSDVLKRHASPAGFQAAALPAARALSPGDMGRLAGTRMAEAAADGRTLTYSHALALVAEELR